MVKEETVMEYCWKMLPGAVMWSISGIFVEFLLCYLAIQYAG